MCQKWLRKKRKKRKKKKRVEEKKILAINLFLSRIYQSDPIKRLQMEPDFKLKKRDREEGRKRQRERN